MPNFFLKMILASAELHETKNALNKSAGKVVKEAIRVALPGYTINNPGLAWAEDVAAHTANGLMKFLGRPTTFKSRDITDIPDSLKDVMRALIMLQGNKPKGSIQSKDWKKYQGTYTGGDRGYAERLFTPSGAVEHTFGLYSYDTDSLENTIVTDIYDFNNGLRTPGNDWYTNFRDLAPLISSRSSDPDSLKRRYTINLGPRKNWKK